MKFKLNLSCFVHRQFDRRSSDGISFPHSCERRGTKLEASIYANVEGISKATNLAEVQQKDYKLIAGIYLGTETGEEDGIPFEEKRPKVK